MDFSWWAPLLDSLSPIYYVKDIGIINGIHPDVKRYENASQITKNVKNVIPVPTC